MPLSADYTIQGFLYQFNKTALEIFNSQDEDIITVEGIVEDIEIQRPLSYTAIQCKYHESVQSFSQSDIYKPLLQMLNHYSKNATENISYVLFAHFVEMESQPPEVGKETFEAALKSKDKSLQKYIEKIPWDIDLDTFESKFEIEFGPSYNELVNQVYDSLKENGIPSQDVEALAYPNTIQMIAALSIKHDPSERKVTKKQFLKQLKSIRKTAISRWTLALKSRKKILDARRKQLKTNLNKNARLRYFIIDPDSIEDYEEGIVLFICDFIEKYHFKPAHTHTPLFCLCTDMSGIQDIQRRLFTKNIVAEDGYIGGEFKESRFFRDPISSKKLGTRFQSPMCQDSCRLKPHRTKILQLLFAPIEGRD